MAPTGGGRRTLTLGQLNEIFQAAMGWTDSHLHSFEVGADSYGTPDPDWGSDLQDERRVRLCQLGLSAGSRLRYTYDFGDDWQHDVLVEQIVAPEPGVAYPGASAVDERARQGTVGLRRAARGTGRSHHEDHEERLGVDGR